MNPSGIIPSPNIWRFTDGYETENRALDPEGLIEAAMRRAHDWAGQTVLDVGCGTGFHLPRFAERAGRVVGVEPHRPLAALARDRVNGTGAAVLAATAQSLPLAGSSVDVAHARWAYFFGPGCEPGLAELDRVVRPGGTAFVIDNDATRSTFGGWFRRSLPRYDPLAVQRFWTRRGWTRESLDVRWAFGSRADLEAVVRIEFAAGLADDLLAEHTGTDVDYAVNLWWRRF